MMSPSWSSLSGKGPTGRLAALNSERKLYGLRRATSFAEARKFIQQEFDEWLRRREQVAKVSGHEPPEPVAAAAQYGESMACGVPVGERVQMVSMTDNNGGSSTLAVVLCHPKAVPPRRQTAGSAGMDLHCVEDVTIPPWSRHLVSTGIKIKCPRGTCGIIMGRSGLALRNAIVAHTGLVDEDYRGEIGVLLHNVSSSPFWAKAGDRIAQLVIERCESPDVSVVDALDDTGRAGGFGSTGMVALVDDRSWCDASSIAQRACLFDEHAQDEFADQLAEYLVGQRSLDTEAWVLVSNGTFEAGGIVVGPPNLSVSEELPTLAIRWASDRLASLYSSARLACRRSVISRLIPRIRLNWS